MHMLSMNIGVDLVTQTHSGAHDGFFYSLFKCCEFGTKSGCLYTCFCHLELHKTGVDPTKQNNPVIDLPVTLSCALLASMNRLMSISGTSGSGNLGSKSSWKYLYWPLKSFFSFTFFYWASILSGSRLMICPQAGYFFRYPSTSSASFRCPCLGAAAYWLREEIAKLMSNLPATTTLKTRLYQKYLLLVRNAKKMVGEKMVAHNTLC